MPASTKISGSFKTVSAIRAKVSGSWKEVTKGSVKVSGAWKEFFTSAQPGVFELLETVIVGSGGQTSVTFSNLNSTYGSTYQHLQIRATIRGTASEISRRMRMRFNSDTGNNYDGHVLSGYSDGTITTRSETATNISYAFMGVATANTNTSNVFSGLVVDISDPFETTKFTTVKALNGFMGGTSAFQQYVALDSGLWRNTAALTSIDISAVTGDLAQYSRISLYGIKA